MPLISSGVNRRTRTFTTLSSPNGATQNHVSYAPVGLPRYGRPLPPAYAGGYRHCALAGRSPQENSLHRRTKLKNGICLSVILAKPENIARISIMAATTKPDKSGIEYRINENCTGCTICAQRCPVSAISARPYRRHSIDRSVCTKCDICRRKCPNDAITVEQDSRHQTADSCNNSANP